jgi:uncharacterized protein
MSKKIPLRRPGAEVGDRHELRESLDVAPFDLYGRHHEITDAQASIGVTCLSDGLHLDTRIQLSVLTTCDRTLEMTELKLDFGDSEFLPGPNNRELSVEDWALDLTRYVERAMPNEVPMQVFSPGTRPVRPESDGGEIDPRWRGLGDLFASGF